nr:hypothetical protein [Thiocapsa imhoffii]
MIVETHPDHPGLVRVHASHEQPVLHTAGGVATPRQPVRLHYVAAFNALHVARMHAQTALGRYLVDSEHGLYRTDPITAIAAVDAIDLAHRERYLDPEYVDDPRLLEQVARRRRRHRINRRIWNGIGLLAIILLILLSQVPIF